MSIFASRELASRIENAECRLLRDAAVAMKDSPNASDMFHAEVGGGFALFTSPDSPLNKVAGLGFADWQIDDTWVALESAFAKRKAAVQVEISTLAEPAVASALSSRGYQLVGFEAILARTTGDAEQADAPALHPDQISLAPCVEGELDLWIDIVVSGFLVPDTQGVASHESFEREPLESVIREFAAIDGFQRYIARVDGTPAGAGSMRVCDGVAQLCGSATLPEFRRRGVQSSFLAHRLSEARKHGADIVVGTTQPGSKSMQNVQKKGFELLYNRAVLIKPPPAHE